jgi:S-(hydroxymethyl)glutathione dehydrogenase/alcohol dehydrogenase
MVNSGALATFMRQTVTCENRVTPIPKAMPLREAALFGCAVLTGVGAVLRTAMVNAGASVAIFGAGGVGLSAVVGARIARAGSIIVVDLFDHKLEQARRLGASHLINAQREQPLEVIREITGGCGADYAIEAAGRQESMESAFAAVREGGGLCVLAGNLAHGGRINIDPFALIRGRRILGTWGGESRPDDDIPRYSDLYLSGELQVSELITHEYRLEEINQALDDLEDGKLGRALLALH